MSIDADRLAKQVKLAYDFIDALHGQAMGLIKDVETQLGAATEQLECLRPGGSYLFTANRMSYSLATPRPVIANYYAAFFRHFPERQGRTTLVDEHTPPIAFVMVVLREGGMDHPEVRYGVITSMTRVLGRDDWPRTVEQTPTPVADKALTGKAPWAGRGVQERDYRDSSLSFHLTGMGVRLADLPDSDAVAARGRGSVIGSVSPGQQLTGKFRIGNRGGPFFALGDGLQQLRCLAALSLDGPVNMFCLAQLISASPDV